MGLEIDSRQLPPTACLSGELSIMTLEALQDDLFGLLNYAEVTLDLTQLDMMDGCGAQLIAMLQQEASRQGKLLHLQLHDESMAKEVLATLGLIAGSGFRETADGYQ